MANKLLLACGVIGPLLNVVIFLILGATRPHYSAWRIPDSSLELGEGGWIQIANYIVTGALMLGFAIGLRRVLLGGRGSTWGPVLLGIYGLTFIGAGVFVTDPTLGYPPGVPSTSTVHGALHDVFGLLQFISVIAACFVLARRDAADPPPGAAGSGIRLPRVCWSSPRMSSSPSHSNRAGRLDSLNGLASLAPVVGSLCWRSAW